MRRIPGALLFFLLLVTMPVLGQAQPAPFGIRVLPAVGIPLQSSATYYQTGLGGMISGEYRLPPLPFLFAQAALAYDYQPVLTSMSLSSFAGFGGAGARWDVLDWLTLRASAMAGYYYAMMNGQSSFPSASNPALIVEAGAQFLREPLRIDVGAQYRYYHGLYSGLAATAGVALSLPFAAGPVHQAEPSAPAKPQPLENKPAQPAATAGPSTESIALDSLQFEVIFPVFFKYYDDHTIGKAVLKNVGASKLEGIKASFQIKQYMDVPKQAQLESSALAPGQSTGVEIYALFTDRILEITEATKLGAEIRFDYVMNGKPQQQTFQQTVRVQHRNAMMWDDNRKASAFVTAKDPAVLLFSNNVNAMVKTSLNRTVNKPFQLAMALHDALMIYGMAYVSNPLTPYSEISKNKLAVDTLKFPKQTFDYRSGDCSDLSILYCALLESMQIETAFITIPGHIFMAFSLDMTPEEARKAFSQADNLIFREDKSWIPLEITERDGGFQKAWDMGAKQWRENLAREQADFYPLHDGWKVYEPVGLPGSASGNLAIPAAEKLVPMFREDVRKFITKEIFPRVAATQAQITKEKDSPKSRNSLGVLYARYDLTTEAEAEFEKVLKKQEYVPALLNMGNLHFQKGSFEDALTFYQRALKKDPKNPRVILAVARADQELEDYGQVRRLYSDLKRIDPALAQQFAYLDLRGEESVRAAEIGNVKGVVLWEDQ